MAMVLSGNEEALVRVVRMLPPVEAERVFQWALHLADMAGGRAIDWSDGWSDEDLAEATAAALRRWEGGVQELEQMPEGMVEG